MAASKKDPLTRLRKKLLKMIYDDISFLYERASIEWDGEADLVQPRPIKDLPLYTSGQRGYINKILATAYLRGEDFTSRRVLYEYSEYFEKKVKELQKAPSVIDYTQGILYAASVALKMIGIPEEKEIADVAQEYATLETANF